MGLSFLKEKKKRNKMGKTRDLFKKIRNTKGTFHTKMSTIKDRNSISESEVTQSCPTLSDPMDCSLPGSSVLHCLREFVQIHVH